MLFTPMAHRSLSLFLLTSLLLIVIGFIQLKFVSMTRWNLKALLVAKGYTRQYGSDYYDTSFLVAKIAYVCLLLSMAASRS